MTPMTYQEFVDTIVAGASLEDFEWRRLGDLEVVLMDFLGRETEIATYDHELGTGEFTDVVCS